MIITDRDRLLLTALTGRVRLLAWEHARTLWPTAYGDRTALKRLAVLTRAGLLVRRYVHSRPALVLTRPATAWTPDEDAPDFHALSRCLQARWKEPPRRTTVYLATRRTAGLLGGTARGCVATPYQSSHDLGVASVYLRYLARDPDGAALWVGEDLLPKAGHGQKRPDAELRTPDGEPVRAVEFGAGYPATRLEAFHRDCVRRSLPYEVW